VALRRLCSPSDAFTGPASIRTIAAHLVISQVAVKQHLARL
jgi:predicted ArsR family transcriptional regulator